MIAADTLKYSPAIHILNKKENNMKKIITILGETLTIAFNMAVQISFEEITGKSFREINTDSSKDNFALAYAAIIANNPDTSITAGNLMRDISGSEFKDLMKAISDAFVEWNDIPDTFADDEDKKKDEPEEGHSYGDPECADDTKNS